MYEKEDDLLENIVYKPCKKCGSVNYDNADCEDPVFTADGKILFHPITCDLCNFELILSESLELH